MSQKNPRFLYSIGEYLIAWAEGTKYAKWVAWKTEIIFFQFWRTEDQDQDIVGLGPF
jgi:hypothetical protein